jgi:hypothetical protein
MVPLRSTPAGGGRSFGAVVLAGPPGGGGTDQQSRAPDCDPVTPSCSIRPGLELHAPAGSSAHSRKYSPPLRGLLRRPMSPPPLRPPSKVIPAAGRTDPVPDPLLLPLPPAAAGEHTSDTMALGGLFNGILICKPCVLRSVFMSLTPPEPRRCPGFRVRRPCSLTAYFPDTGLAPCASPIPIPTKHGARCQTHISLRRLHVPCSSDR